MKETKDSDESVTLCLWMQAEHKKRCTVLFVMLSDFLMLCSNAKPHYLAPALSLCQIWLCYERGTIQSSPHLPNETAPSLLLVIFLDPFKKKNLLASVTIFMICVYNAVSNDPETGE